MDVEVKQRNRRRRRAQRMQAQRCSEKTAQGEHQGDGDSADDDDNTITRHREKPQRPPNRRKKAKEPLCEEDIIEGFSILQFRTYEDLELVLKIASKENIKRLAEIERPKLETKTHIQHHISAHNNHTITLTHQDPATSDDSGRASERLTGSSVAPRDADSSRDRLSDTSSRCSSGKGYICDSEGEDDKGSDASSVIFASTPASRKREFPGALPPSLPLHNGTSNSPVPAPTPPNLPVPSPAPAQQPPLPIPVVAAATVKHEQQPQPPPPPPPPPSSSTPVVLSQQQQQQQQTQQPQQGAAATATATSLVPPSLPQQQQQQQPPPSSVPSSANIVPVTMPQAAAATPIAHPHPPPALDSTTGGGGVANNHHGMRTDSPAVATSANVAVAPSAGQYHHQPYNNHHIHHHHHHQPLYAPYAVHTPYATTNSTTTSSNSNNSNSATATAVAASAVTAVAPVVVTQQQQQQQPATNTTPLATTAATTTTIPQPIRPLSPPRGHSPNRERDSYSNVSSLSRGSVTTPLSCPPPPTTVSSSSLAMNHNNNSNNNNNSNSKQQQQQQPPPQSWSGPTPTLSPAAPPRPTPPLHSSFPPPMFTAPLPPVSRSSPLAPTVQPSNPNPFSAESLFQTNQADMLRRELDNRFLASQDRSLGVAPPPYLRTEMHQHQHHHTHVHQHTTSLIPPPGASSLFPSPLTLSPTQRLARRSGSSVFKDIPKLGGVDSTFYRQNISMSNYPGYTPSLIHGLTAGPTPFVPPNHLPTFQPKSVPPDPTKPKMMKTGKWNAMHVRVAWEIYHHQQKNGEAKGGTTKSDLLRPPSHLFSPSVHATRPHDLTSATFPPSMAAAAAAAAAHRPPGGFVDPQPPPPPPPHPTSLFTTPPSHLASTMSPFTRYGAAAAAAAAAASFGATAASPFGISPFASARELTTLGPLHDPWRGLQRTVPNFPPSVNSLPPSIPGLPPAGPWSIKPDPILEQQREREAREREERERERARREREERERREREEKQRRLEQQQQAERERERERREKERREMERREMERERERILHQQRLAENAKMASPQLIRDRSPLRNGDHNDIRIKEEPRTKEEDMLRGDPRYHHPFLRHPSLQPPPSLLDRSRILSHSLGPPPPPTHHYPPPPQTASHWPPTAADHFYRGYEPLRYNPLVDVMRVEEERAKLFGTYGSPAGPPPHPSSHSQLRPKDAAALMHLRPGPGPPPPPPPSSQTQQSSTQPPQSQQTTAATSGGGGGGGGGPPTPQQLQQQRPPSNHNKMSVTPPTDLHKKEETR